VKGSFPRQEKGKTDFRFNKTVVPGPGYYNVRSAHFDKAPQGNLNIGEHMGAKEINSKA
jgi:hypothetical protein